MSPGMEFLGGAVARVDVRQPDWEKAWMERAELISAGILPNVSDLEPFRRVLDSAGIREQPGAASRPIPVICAVEGVGRNCAETGDIVEAANRTLEQIRIARDRGACAVTVPSPVQLLPLAGQTPGAVVYRYFRDVQAKSVLPLVISQPAQTRREHRLDADGIQSLVRLGRVVGLIMGEGDREEVADNVRAGRRGTFAVLCGESMFPEALEWGASGIVLDLKSGALPEIARTLRARSTQSAES